MRSSFRLFCAALFAASSIGFAIAPVAGATAERASIIPLVNQFLGPSVNNIPGFSIYANGISGYWVASSSATVSFAILVFPTRQVTQDIGFSVMPPNGNKPVYTNTFKAQSIGPVGTWFTVSAVGDYSAAGVYNAIVTADGTEIGRIPLVFTAPSN
jgi:hypothetical protein